MRTIAPCLQSGSVFSITDTTRWWHRLLVWADTCKPLPSRNRLGSGCRDDAVSATSLPVRIRRPSGNAAPDRYLSEQCHAAAEPVCRTRYFAISAGPRRPHRIATPFPHKVGSDGGSLGDAKISCRAVGLSRLTAKSQWLNLARDRLTYHHEFAVGSKLTPWLGVALERKRQSGVAPVPDARAREGLFGMRWKGELGSLHLRHTRRFERSRRPLAFLASPHRATTRLTGLDLIPVIGRKTSNLKVVLSFEYRKISSLDPYRPRSSRILILRLSYDAFKR